LTAVRNFLEYSIPIARKGPATPAAKDHPFNNALDAAHAKGIGLISMKQLAGSESKLKDMATKVPSLKDKGLAPYQMLQHAI
jgi:uncharacterized protein